MFKYCGEILTPVRSGVFETLILKVGFHSQLLCALIGIDVISFESLVDFI